MNITAVSINDVTAGVCAARAGDTGALRAWLDAGGDVNVHDNDGWTPLLAAAVRGHADAVDLLLAAGRADPALPHAKSGALPIHFAGHSGSIPVAARLLSARPEHLDEVWLLNGHTLLLQAAFYGHVELARWAVAQGANMAATTLRGLGAFDMAAQFQNAPLMEALRPYDASAEMKHAYYAELLQRIEPEVPPQERGAQQLADALVAAMAHGLTHAASDRMVTDATLESIRQLVVRLGADVNRPGGVLRQPPLVVVVTGNNGTPANRDVAEFRLRVAERLLEYGADPTRAEVHPMGADAFIRACVFNHLEILELMALYVEPDVLAAALNRLPVVNGLTALHDSVLRASTAAPDRIDGYLAQIRWAVSCGARWDIEDFSGRTQRSIAENAADPAARARILDALGIPPVNMERKA